MLLAPVARSSCAAGSSTYWDMDQDPDVRMAASQFHGCPQPLVRKTWRHSHVDNGDLRLLLRYRRQQRRTVTHRRHHLESGVSKQAFEACPQ